MYVSGCVCVCVSVCVHVCDGVCVHMRACVCVCVFVHVYWKHKYIPDPKDVCIPGTMNCESDS